MEQKQSISRLPKKYNTPFKFFFKFPLILG